MIITTDITDSATEYSMTIYDIYQQCYGEWDLYNLGSGLGVFWTTKFSI